MRASGVVRLALAALALVGIAACATESHRTLETETTQSYGDGYTGPRAALVLGVFENRSPYMSGLFSDGVDRLGGQAKTILKTHLSQTGRFDLLDRDNMTEIAKEAQISGSAQQLVGASYVLTGQVTEFGRRDTGDRELFGILGHGTTQTAYSKVSLNVVDVRTSQVVYSVQGAGEYAMSEREVAGFGSTAGYDATLNGKVLNLSVLDAVNKLVGGMKSGAWTPAMRP